MRLVEMREISKSFGSVCALDSVSLSIDEGEVLGIVGDNAAGKSTLMKILTGAYQPDKGHIFMDLGLTIRAPGSTGEPPIRVCENVEFKSPEDSRRVGIEMVYQDLALVGCLDVAANLYLGREQTRFRLGPIRVLDKAEMRNRAADLIGNLGIKVKDPGEVVDNLSGGQRQAIAIARAAAFHPRLVILDEPTAALSLAAISHVHDLIRALRGFGVAVVLISHRLDDILDVCDSAVALYQGRKLLEIDLHRNARAWNRDWLIRAMEGRVNED